MNPPSPLRPVEFQQYVKICQVNPDNKPATIRHEFQTFTGLFHCFSLEGDGQDIGPVAIIETPDGQVYCPAASKIKFLDK